MPDERLCSQHRDCGAALLAELLGTTARDVIDHMYGLGVDVPPVPLLGDVCPLCGRRMPVNGRARASGVCTACHERTMRELREARDGARRERARTWRLGNAPSDRPPEGDGDWPYVEWRYRDGYL